RTPRHFNILLYFSGNSSITLEKWYNSAQILAKLGYCLVAEGRLDEAITTYQKALQLNPNWADVYLKMGKVLSQQNRWE
ncbi:tetratricopeptide repeat protein, partial [Microcoleus sp. F4-D5]|uniref:tetratricopeptide repeat protein n=1 Tax=Microcoleus sp. F4-D5 TaxID=2818760 RepID=UPI002FD568EC